MEVSIDTISQLLGKTPHEIRGTLNPINSIVDLPSDDTKQVYHQGREIFPWITPQIFQEWLKQLGMPTDPPPGVRNKWDEFMDEEPWKLPHIRMRATYKNESLFPIPMCILTFIDVFIARVPSANITNSIASTISWCLRTRVYSSIYPSQHQT